MDPRVKTVEPPEGPPGSNVAVRGLNFSDKKDDYDISANGGKCLVLECGLEMVRFLLPAGAQKPEPGPLKIKISIKGHGECTANFKVLDVNGKDKAGEAARRDADRQKYEGASTYEDPFKQNEKLLSITKFEVVGGASPTAVIEGETSLPKDFFLTVDFGVVGQTEQLQVAAHKVSIKGNTWKTTFGVPPVENWAGKTLLAGKYYVHVLFEMAKQSPLNLKRVGWPEKLSDGERVARDIVWKKEIKDVGTADEAKKQDEEIRGHYVELCRETTDCFEVLERAYAAAGKCYFKKTTGSSLDEDEWAKWVVSRGVGQTDDDMKKIKADNRFVKGVFFAPDAWEQWVVNDLFKKLGEAYRKHDDVKNKYVGTRDKRVEVEGDYLLTIVLKLTQQYSGEIYGRAKLPVPDDLRAPKEFTGGLETLGISRQHFEGHRRALLDRLGLSSFDPGAKDPNGKDPAKKDDKK
jgi:hypothetical protein